MTRHSVPGAGGPERKQPGSLRPCKPSGRGGPGPTLRRGPARTEADRAFKGHPDGKEGGGGAGHDNPTRMGQSQPSPRARAAPPGEKGARGVPLDRLAEGGPGATNERAGSLLPRGPHALTIRSWPTRARGVPLDRPAPRQRERGEGLRRQASGRCIGMAAGRRPAASIPPSTGRS